MKKLFIALIFSTVLFIGLPNFKVNAMSVTYDVPFSAVPDLADMFLGILSGGQFDLSDVETLEEAAEKHKASLQQGYHFLQGFSTKIFNKLVTEAGIGNTSINENTDFPIQVSLQDLASFMGYNINWWEREQTLETPDVALDVSATNFNTYFHVGAPNITSDCSFTSTTAMLTFSPNGNYEQGFPTSDSWLVFNGDLHIDIINGHWHAYSDGICTSAYTGSATGLYMAWWTGSGWIFPLQSSSETSKSPSVVLERANNTLYNISTDNLSAMLNYVPSFARCCTLYVNGVLYSYYGDNDYITAPDVYGVGDLGLDIYDVFFPKTDSYSGFSFNGFLEWLKGQLGNKDVGIDDLIEDAPDIIITVDENNEPTTRPITTEDTRPVPIIIDGDVTADPEPDSPTPTPEENERFPLPLLPKFPMPSGLPNNIQHTVLAEIIDATQQAVPSDLMILIWSTFGLLVVGGLIYILHK